ncbi:MAG: hypothetical protein U1E20_05700 [Methylocystis sp.]|uniref:hypothetical protein n=1 Tax=Methylocystis sp. TaxID=1911079 RepID=UPI00393E5C57
MKILECEFPRLQPSELQNIRQIHLEFLEFVRYRATARHPRVPRLVAKPSRDFLDEPPDLALMRMNVLP